MSLQLLFKKFLSLINKLPRLHFWVLILLFILLILISLIPQPDLTDKQVRKELVLPVSTSTQAGPSVASPQNTTVSKSPSLYPDFSDNKEVSLMIKAGDTLSEIFSNENISAATLQDILEADAEHIRLANLLPGQEIRLLINPQGELLALKVIIDRANTLSFVLKDGEYISKLDTKKGEWRNNYYQGTVTGSFYVSAKRSGLTSSQIQQISNALQDKFDFSRQLRAGDSFNVLVAKQYIEGSYSFESEVLAVIIKTRSKNYTAFLNEDGRYYDKDGMGLTKAYRRYPVNGRPRISSPFNPRRLHPITKRIRPHNGTDFAVPVGTNVYSIGDGVVLRAGYHPAAGNYIVIKHGRKYTTRYLHLSKRLVKQGQHVAMGQIIAKSGNTGSSTGAHLHYEFHINGKPVDAMKVSLPLSQEVAANKMKAFKARRDLALKEMGQL